MSDEKKERQKRKERTRAKRTKEIRIRMSDDEYNIAKYKASEFGYPLSSYARHTILNQEIIDKKQAKIEAKYLSQIAWIGNNINQLSKIANSKKAQDKLEELDLVELNIRLHEIDEELKILTEFIKNETEK